MTSSISSNPLSLTGDSSSVPRQQIYENPLATSPEQRFAHFGGGDHRRFCGLDFAERLVRAGIGVATFRVSLEEEVRYGLLRDEWLTIASKPVTQAAERDHVGVWLDRTRSVKLDCYGH